jgi:uncharacterized protein (DUF4415 family)
MSLTIPPSSTVVNWYFAMAGDYFCATLVSMSEVSESTTNTTTLTPAARVPIHLQPLDKTQVTINIDPDIVLACEDQARSMGVTLQAWYQQTINDALRSYIGS